MAPLSYVNPSYREPSSSAGSNILLSEPGLARPSINHTGGSKRCTLKHKHTKCKTAKRRGGFFPPPSVMASFIPNAARLTPAAFVSGYRMVRNYKSASKQKNRTRK